MQRKGCRSGDRPAPHFLTVSSTTAISTKCPTATAPISAPRVKARESLNHPFGLYMTAFMEVSLTDSELGELIRYMTQYGEGGFQGRLRRAFLRSVYELLAVKV